MCQFKVFLVPVDADSGAEDELNSFFADIICLIVDFVIKLNAFIVVKV